MGCGGYPQNAGVLVVLVISIVLCDVITHPCPTGLALDILKVESWTQMGRTANIIIKCSIHVFASICKNMRILLMGRRYRERCPNFISSLTKRPLKLGHGWMRCNTCYILSHWLRPCSTRDRKRGMVMDQCISEFGHHWFKWWLTSYFVILYRTITWTNADLLYPPTHTQRIGFSPSVSPSVPYPLSTL